MAGLNRVSTHSVLYIASLSSWTYLCQHKSDPVALQFKVLNIFTPPRNKVTYFQYDIRSQIMLLICYFKLLQAIFKLLSPLFINYQKNYCFFCSSCQFPGQSFSNICLLNYLNPTICRHSSNNHFWFQLKQSFFKVLFPNRTKILEGLYFFLLLVCLLPFN